MRKSPGRYVRVNRGPCCRTGSAAGRWPAGSDSRACVSYGLSSVSLLEWSSRSSRVVIEVVVFAVMVRGEHESFDLLLIRIFGDGCVLDNADQSPTLEPRVQIEIA